MIQRIWMFFIVFFLGFLQTGCGRNQDTIYLEKSTPETEQMTETVAEPNLPEQSASSVKICYVYVCGAVVNPGVYMLKENDRVYEAIALAGGLSEMAAAEAINQAGMITDGQMIRVPTREEAELLLTEMAGGEETAADGRVNVNTASAAELMTLPRIGQAKADAIVAYRTKNGEFSTTEEIMNVEGIKEGVYNRIKDDIKVK